MTTTLTDTLKHLEQSSIYLESISNHPKVFNTDLGYYLAVAARDVFAEMKNLQQLSCYYGDIK